MSNQLQAQEPSYPAFVRKLFNRSGDPSKDFTHAILGIATEIREYLVAVDDVNAVEELGDMAFYVEALQQVIEDFMGELPMQDIEEQVERELLLLVDVSDKRDILGHMVNELLDQAKRWIGYNREPASLAAVFADAMATSIFATDLGRMPIGSVSQPRIKSVNMAKLLKRYPGGDFDQFRALQRDLGAERATLESAVLV